MGTSTSSSPPPPSSSSLSSSSSQSSSSTSPGFIQIWTSTVPMLTICVATIAANGAVLTMFASRQGLRRYKNIYFLSLALADFIVGLTTPVKMTFDLNRSWPLNGVCRVFQSAQQAFMYVSFLSIFLIILDKWRAVHYPMSYRGNKSKRLALAAVMMVWVTSLVIFAIPILWWDYEPTRKHQSKSFSQLFHFAKSDGNNVGTSLSSRSISNGSSDSNSNSNSNTSSQTVVEGYNLTTEDHGESTNSGTFSNNNNNNNNVHSTTSLYCPEGYHLHFNTSILSTVVFYFIPLFIMFFFDISVYLKIKWRKSVEVQRSTSVTDTYFMTLKKPAFDLDNCVHPPVDDPAKESLLKNSDSKPINKHLAVAARGERRHSSLPAISPIIKGRTSSGRRVSMPEGNASAGGCRYVGRKWSGCVSNMSGNTSPNPMANLGPRLHNEDLVHDILLKKDKKIARCLCLMLGVMVACWLPHAVVIIVNSRCGCVTAGTIVATSWLCLLSHGINPFLYVLMMAQFKNVLKQWLIMERVHAFKMRDTLILKNLQRKIASEEDSNTKDKSPLPSTKEAQFHLPQIDKTEKSSV